MRTGNSLRLTKRRSGWGSDSYLTILAARRLSCDLMNGCGKGAGMGNLGPRKGSKAGGWFVRQGSTVFAVRPGLPFETDDTDGFLPVPIPSLSFNTIKSRSSTCQLSITTFTRFESESNTGDSSSNQCPPGTALSLTTVVSGTRLGKSHWHALMSRYHTPHHWLSE